MVDNIVIWIGIVAYAKLKKNQNYLIKKKSIFERNTNIESYLQYRTYKF